MATVFGGPKKDVEIKTSILDVCPGPGQYRVPSTMDKAGGSTAHFSPQRKKNGFGNSTRDDFQSYFRHKQPLESPTSSSYALMPFVEGSFENVGSRLTQTVPGRRRLDTAGRPMKIDKDERELYKVPKGTLLSSMSRLEKDPHSKSSPTIPKTTGTGKYNTGTDLGRSAKLSRIRNGASMNFGSFERDMFRDHLQGRWREAQQTPGPNAYYPTANISFSAGSLKRKGRGGQGNKVPANLSDDKLYAPPKNLRPGAFGDSKRLPFGDTTVLPKSADFVNAESKKLSKKQRERMRAQSLQKAVDLENDKKPDGRPKTPFDAYRKPWNPKNPVAKTLFGTAERPFHAHIERTPSPGEYDTETGTRMAYSKTANARCGYRPVVASAGGSSGQPFSIQLKEKEETDPDSKHEWNIKIDTCNDSKIKDYQKHVDRLVKEMKSGKLSLNPQDRALTPKTNQRRIYTSIDKLKPPTIPNSPVGGGAINIMTINSPLNASSPSVVTFADPIEETRSEKDTV